MEMPANAKDLFDNILPGKVAGNPDAASALGAVFHFSITGDNGGDWTADLASKPPSVSKGHVGTANCSITIAHDDFMNLLQNPASGMQLYFTGKLKVGGDPMLATKLGKIFNL